MHTIPALQVKSVDQLIPGELTVAEVGGRRVPAVFTHHFAKRDGDPSPVLIHLVQPGRSARGPFWSFETGSMLSLGTDYAFVADAFADRPTATTAESWCQLLVARDQRFLRVWDQDGRFSLALDLDTGKASDPSNLVRPSECFSWELRLKINGEIDFRSPPLYRWDAASVTGDKANAS